MGCFHHFLQTKDTPRHYEVCVQCGTYISLKADPSIYTDSYWSEKHGHGSLYEQAYNVDLATEGGVSKNRFILERIASDRGAALEIGCAPGRMLYWLTWAARFKEVWGVDPAPSELIRKIGCHDGFLWQGMFEEVFSKPTTTRFDYILASDVFEHSTQPIEFLAACARLLKPGGQLFLMLPLADGLPADSRMFNSVEHAFLHSRANMISMLEDAGFERIQTDQWAIGHDTITGFKS